VNLDTNQQVLTLNFDNANKYTIAQGGGGKTLTVGNGTTGTINVAQGTHEISAPLALSGAVSKTGTGTLRISGAQSHAAGSSLNVSAGSLNLSSNAGTAATGAAAATSNLTLTISGSGSTMTLGSSQDLKDLTIQHRQRGDAGCGLASPAVAGRILMRCECIRPIWRPPSRH